MQNSARWVLPVMSVSRWRSARSVIHGFGSAFAGREPRDLGERDLQLVERLRAALVDPRRLRRRADEPPGEQVGQRRVALPVGQHRHQQIGTAQHRRIGGGDTAQRDVVAAAGAAVGAVDVERLGGQPRQPGLLVERLQLLLLLGEARRRRHVDLDDTGIGRDGHRREPRVRRRSVALDHHRAVDLGRRGLDAGDQIDEVLQSSVGGRIHVQQAVADLGHHGGRRAARRPPRRRRRRRPVRRGSAHRGAPAGRLVRSVRGGLPADRVQRQPQPGGRIAVEQHDAPAAQLPVGAGPSGVVVATVQRQHVRGGFGDRSRRAGPATRRGRRRCRPPGRLSAATGSPSG